MLKLYTYKLPFRQAFKTADNSYDHREGLILQYSENDLQAYGEIAPLPGFSRGNLAQVVTILQMQRTQLQSSLRDRNTDDLFFILHNIHQFPSLSFGLDMLYTDLRSQEEGLSFGRYVAKELKTEPYSIPVNFTSGIRSPDEILKMINHKTKEGFDTLKLKAGKDRELLEKTIQRIREEYPDLRIRLDANESWQEEEAMETLSRLSNFNIEYCEQPVTSDRPELLKRLSDRSPVPIAADESIRNISDAKRLSEEQSAKLFIIKPMFFGRINDIIVTKQMADSHNISMVFTTALESAIGRKAVCELASVLGNENLAHGLDTGSLFLNDLSEKMVIKNGTYIPDDRPGLGLYPDASLLKEI